MKFDRSKSTSTPWTYSEVRGGYVWSMLDRDYADNDIFSDPPHARRWGIEQKIANNHRHATIHQRSQQCA